MSQVFRFSRSFILMMAIILLAVLSSQIGLCQTSKTDIREDFVAKDYEQDEPMIDQDLDLGFNEGELDMLGMTTINSQDVQNIFAKSSGPVGLWSGLKTDIMFGEDGSILKSRKAGVFTYGSEILQIDEITKLSIKNDEEFFYYDFDQTSEIFDLSNTMTSSNYPFVFFRENLTKIFYDQELIESGFELLSSDTSSTTYILMYDEYKDLYEMTVLFEDSEDWFEDEYSYYGSDISDWPDDLDVHMDMYFTSDI